MSLAALRARAPLAVLGPLGAAFVVATAVACGGDDDGSSGGTSSSSSGGASSSSGGASSSSGDGSAPTGSCPAGQTGAPKGYLAGQKLVVAGVKDAGYANRTYDVFVPDTHGSAPLPLVFAFHGNGGDGAGLRAGFGIEAAAAGKAIVVYPDGFGGWDLDSAADDNDDIRFVKGMIAALGASHCIDATRVFATGFSNGAYFANQLGCKVGASVFRGIAAHAGGGPYGANDEYDENGNLICAGQPVPAAIFHGTDDGNVSLSEGQSSRDHWKRVNACSDAAADVAPAPCVRFDGCTRAVQYCEIPGLGHAIWNDGAAATWAFFSGL